MGAARTNIALIGLRRSGKTTLGRRLAAHLGADFADLDAVVEECTGRSPAEWIRSEGEAAFREAELTALRAVCAVSVPRGLVLAAGGGTPTVLESAALLQSFGRVIHLELSADEAVRRALADSDASTRPLLVGRSSSEEARMLHAMRTRLYRACAELSIPADGAPDAVFSALSALL
ncbi:MAG: shikimate kinase [Planctomycetes bacterium]|nr:shikimate kinase [Planctomycetota bacterium]